MKKFIIGVAALLLLAGGILLGMAPDTLSLIILICMCGVLAMGFFLGLLPSLMFTDAFKTGRGNVEQALDVQSAETWIAVFKLDSLFRHTMLDKLFAEYKSKAEALKEDEAVICDIEEYINEDVLSLRTWQGVVLQVPGTLTGLGILGTFVGLITGISSLGFSSVEATLDSIALLLSGIKTAFYTSIAGVILSILFNILNRMIWNVMLREHGLFVEQFRKNVIPSVEEQEREMKQSEFRAVLERLDRIPKNGEYSLANGNLVQETSVSNEQVLMSQIRNGLKNDEFTFYLQPRVELGTRKIVAADALVRWNHENLGVVAPSTFIPILEKNGFITHLDRYVWEMVFMKIRNWIDAGDRPVPVSVNVSKMDILAMDVPGFFESMLAKYRIPPRNLEVEIARNAFTQNMEATEEAAAYLRQLGFKVIIDGFDGDYISLNMLKDVQADALKLDLRFLPEKQSNVLQAIFDQARKLNVEMLVEGIENTEQITVLKRVGCNCGQGFYFYKPMSIAEYENMVSNS